MTSNPEVVSSLVGLVPRNALVTINSQTVSKPAFSHRFPVRAQKRVLHAEPSTRFEHAEGFPQNRVLIRG
jgi:hypothetical protein